MQINVLGSNTNILSCLFFESVATLKKGWRPFQKSISEKESLEGRWCLPNIDLFTFCRKLIASTTNRWHWTLSRLLIKIMKQSAFRHQNTYVPTHLKSAMSLIVIIAKINISDNPIKFRLQQSSVQFPHSINHKEQKLKRCGDCGRSVHQSTACSRL